MSNEREERINPFLEGKYIRNKKSAYQDNCTVDGNDLDEDNIHTDMTASYSEISFHANYNINSNETEEIKEVGNSEHIRNSSDENYASIENGTAPEEKGKGKNPKRPASLICNKSFPYNLEGTVSKDGDMTHFVAENLEYKIKLSSPVTKKDSSQAGSSRNSTPSASGLISRQFLLPQQPPQIDSNVLNDIEIEAQYLAASVDNLTENLCNLLHSISSITADNVEIHKNAVNKLTDSMDANIKSMYTIMAKTEEISKSMKPTEQLASRIREIKRLVDMLEGTL